MVAKIKGAVNMTKDNTIIIMLLILGHMLKLYTGILKDQSMNGKGRK